MARVPAPCHSPTTGKGARSLGEHHVRNRKLDAAVAAADFDENLRFEQVSEWHARCLPRIEVLSDGYRPALTGSFPNAVVLRPTRHTVAARATRPGRLPRVEDVIAPIDLHGTLVAGVPWVDRHAIERVIDDVPFDARVGRPAVDSYVRVATTAARLFVREVCRDRAVRIVGLAGVPPLEADASQEVPRVVPIRFERRSAEGGNASVARVVGPKLPGEVVLPALAVPCVLRAVGRHRRVAVEWRSATAARARTGRASAGLPARSTAATAAARFTSCPVASEPESAPTPGSAAPHRTSSRGASLRTTEWRASHGRVATRGTSAGPRTRVHPSGCSSVIGRRAPHVAHSSLARRAAV